jgi:hypothetical protein
LGEGGGEVVTTCGGVAMEDFADVGDAVVVIRVNKMIKY